MGIGPTDTPERFSLVVGGPFHGLLRRLGLTGPDELPRWVAAVVLALLAWLPLVLLAWAQALVQGEKLDVRLLSDWTVHTRYLVAIGVMVATERYAEGRIVLLIRQFRDAQILRDDALPAFLKALSGADRRSGSAIAEAVIFVAALAWSSFTEGYVVVRAGSSWEGQMIDGEVVLSWAGQAARFVSNPLFVFLMLRWVWRFLVWTGLLVRISRLPLQLTPLHPDRSGGLGFMAIYPSIFSGFVFALSCVIASSFLKDMGLERRSDDTVWLALAAWIGFNLVLFLGPLLVFASPLYRLRERSLLEYGRLASQHHLAFHRKWIDETRHGEDLLGSADPSSASDLNASVDAVHALRLVPLDLAAVVQLLLSAGLPLLAVVTTQMPLRELAMWIIGAIL